MKKMKKITIFIIVALTTLSSFSQDKLGHIGPFQGAIALTALALVLVLPWEENYGEKDSDDDHSLYHQFIEGWGATLSDSRIWRIGMTQALSEGGMFTSRRLYLRVTWEKYQYDMCCAPFGSGMFLSWWLIYNTTNREAIISRIPFLGKWLNKTFFPTTYFQLDSAAMFMTYCHHSMLAVAEKITKESGFRINDNDRKPVLKDIFKR